MELAPGVYLDELALSNRYHLSRTPIREVLRQLAGEGYVEIQERRGVRVTPLRHSTFSELISVAPMVYSAIGRLAAQNVTPAQVHDLEQAQRRFRTATCEKDVHVMIIEDKRFHSIIGEMSGNHYLQPSHERLLIDHARVFHNFYRPKTHEMDAALKLAVEQHDMLIEVINKGEENSAANLVLEHFKLFHHSTATAPHQPSESIY